MNNVTCCPRSCEKCKQDFLPRSNSACRCETCCTFVCRHCSSTFKSRRRRKIAFCSITCTNAWQATAAAKEQARLNTIKARGSGVVQRCLTCNDPFYIPGWRLKRTAKYCCHACRNYHADMKGINRVLRFPANKRANRLEAAGHAILESFGIPFLEQQVIGGKFVVDAILPAHRVIVQWDGDFWHANPAYFSTLHSIQQANVARDRACNAYLNKCGYTVLRFWESEVRTSPSTVANVIRECLMNSGFPIET